MALLMQHGSSTPEPPSTHESSVPKELDEIVLQCLEKSPEDRVQSAGELGERLGAVPLDEFWSERQATAWWGEHMDEINGQDRDTDPDQETAIWLPDRRDA